MQLSEQTNKASPLPALVDDPVALRIREKHAKKAEARATKHVEVEKGERPLILERLPNGLYFLRFDGGGMLPEELKGKFTSIAKINSLVEKRYGRNIIK